MYDSRFEHDACGIGFVADAGGRASRGVVDAALVALHRVRHRGAVAADHRSGDGAGLLLAIPEAFLRDWMERAAIRVEPSARLGVAVVFLPNGPGAEDHHQRRLTRRLFDEACRAERLDLVDWRPMPVDLDALGDLARSTAPQIEQGIIIAAGSGSSAEAEARCCRARTRAGPAIRR